ncbi:MAG: extracellular solute-binding protein, partial [Clostridia bacterium]|nr:extracellular solute-binding protein [Clostridia bacterium]
DSMGGNSRSVAGPLERVKSNLGSMSEWLRLATEQELELDKITVLPQGTKTPKAERNFFERLVFWIKSFIASYFTDYNSIATSTKGEKKTLKVWVSTGRDQAEIVRDMINSSFVEQYDASVSLEIVSGTLLQSVLAGNSPDVVLNNAEGTPMDFALRHAVVNLREFDDFDEVAKQFPAASIKPAEFNGEVYGFPQAFSFPMFFYRKDIFEEYGYSVPKTWKELCELIPSLQRNQMEAGVPSTMFSTFLYQHGGEYYNDNGKSCRFNDPVTLEAFADFTDMFTLYDCPVTFSFVNRFRTGEMPCAVQDYSIYNTLIASAPEIKGLWEMIPIPGYEDVDGNINNVAIGETTYMMMMRSCENRDLAWEFMKWYMSTDVQIEYASRMESILGACAKVSTANVEALSKMSWSRSEFENLSAQMEHIDAVPQVPGGYYLGRMTTFAFSRVYNESDDPAESLSDYVKEFNDELTRKRAEFGLE